MGTSISATATAGRSSDGAGQSRPVPIIILARCRSTPAAGPMTTHGRGCDGAGCRSPRLERRPPSRSRAWPVPSRPRPGIRPGSRQEEPSPSACGSRTGYAGSERNGVNPHLGSGRGRQRDITPPNRQGLLPGPCRPSAARRWDSRSSGSPAEHAGHLLVAIPGGQGFFTVQSKGCENGRVLNGEEDSLLR